MLLWAHSFQSTNARLPVKEGSKDRLLALAGYRVAMGESFFQEIGVMGAFGQDPQPPQDIPSGMEIAKRFGLEILPPPDA